MKTERYFINIEGYILNNTDIAKISWKKGIIYLNDNFIGQRKEYYLPNYDFEENWFESELNIFKPIKKSELKKFDIEHTQFANHFDYIKDTTNFKDFWYNLNNGGLK